MIPRRAMLGLGPAAILSCERSDGVYLGNTDPPESARLVHTLAGEVGSLDPAKSTGGWEFYLMPALFEGLTQYHPDQPRLMAALATHYEVNTDFTQFRFYLRGHPAPKGIRLTSSADLAHKYPPGRRPSPDSIPARWSDGGVITAADFVYSWRRFVEPHTAAPQSFLMLIVANAEEIMSGKRPSHELGVRAPDEFTFVVDLGSAAPYFPEVVTNYAFAAVPRQAIEAAKMRNAEGTWTEPPNIVTSGAFALRRHRPHEGIELARNPMYYDASLVALDELAFLPIIDGTTVMNLYKSGDVTVTTGLGLSPLFIPALSRKKDFHVAPAFGTRFAAISTGRAPFANVLLRYALNMATTKVALAKTYGAAYVPASSLTAPIPDYHTPAALDITVDGRTYNVLSFDIEGARSLLAKAGFPDGKSPDGQRLQIPYHFATVQNSALTAAILQQQWTNHLNVEVKLVPREVNVHLSLVREADYTGVADYTSWPLYRDPVAFLDRFADARSGNPSGWSDPSFTSDLMRANKIRHRTERLNQLAACERRLLEAMPFMPLFHSAFQFLCKPFVRGISAHLFEARTFKYVWIDRSWRAS